MAIPEPVDQYDAAGAADEGDKGRHSFLRRCWWTIQLLLAVAIVAPLAALFIADIWFKEPGPLVEEILVLIPSGAGLTKATHILDEAGALQNKYVFMFGVWQRSATRDLRAGEYEIPAGASMDAILEKIRGGDVIQRRLRVIEGSTVAEVMRILEDNEFLEGDLPPPPFEGEVAPETYFFTRGEQRSDVLQRMVGTQRQILDELWQLRAENLPIASPTEALVLASIIEKETALAEERPRVAAVFVNRLHRRMRLQSDPTVIYGITGGEAPLGRPLSRADLKSSSPYNTYQTRGLPPGPIANPGRASIEAALNPAETDELYFVADGTGGHVFATTLKEHNRNVARWRRNQNP